METPEGKTNWELFYKVSEWWWARKLDTAYLNTSPGIWFWREDDQVQIQWDNTHMNVDDLPAWSTEKGQVSISIPDFLAEVQSFNERLIQAMAERVDTLRRGWTRPDVRLDWPKLREEHHDRAGKLSRVLAKSPQQTNWDWVREALTMMERRLADINHTGNASEADTD